MQAARRERAKSPAKARTVSKRGSRHGAVGMHFQDAQHVESLVKDEQKLGAVVSELIGYAEKDHNMAETEVEYGEALYNLLKLPIDSQKPIVLAIAQKNKVPIPEYPPADEVRGRGRPQTGRKQLAEALYGKWPEMLMLEGNNKDTRAGMQITDHKRRYMIRTGLMSAPESKAQLWRVSRRVLRRSFEALWTVAQSDREKKLLTVLYGRLGVEQQDITEWEEEASNADESQEEPAIAS